MVAGREVYKPLVSFNTSLGSTLQSLVQEQPFRQRKYLQEDYDHQDLRVPHRYIDAIQQSYSRRRYTRRLGQLCHSGGQTIDVYHF